MSRTRVVFCGTPWFAVPSLKHLLEHQDFEIVGVFTQPDRPRGRGQEISYSPVKEIALAEKIRVFQPAKVRAPEVEQQLRELTPEMIVIIAYGQIIPGRLLGIPKHGWINLHASLLPKYRGAAPIHWAIVNGETRTGLTTMRIDAGMDTGEMLLQEELAIGADETAPELAGRMAKDGAPLMLQTLRGLVAATVTGRAQNHAEATLAPPLKREDGRIEWARSAEEVYNRMRGFAPWPGAYTEFRGQTCHVWGKPVSNEKAEAAPPGAIFARGAMVRVVCGAGSLLELGNVKLEGRKEVRAAEFANGARLQAGERFGKQ